MPVEDEPGPDADLDCAVCLQPSVHPVRLPCGHLFCFLCVKGIAFLSGKCAMCRRDIPRSCLEDPDLVLRDDPALLPVVHGGDDSDKEEDDGEARKWFYQGRNGWWEYDERTSQELEAAYEDGKQEIELLVAGFIYVIDLVNMTQCRKDGTGRVRSIKRDLASIPDRLGVAGLRVRAPSRTSPPAPSRSSRANPVDAPVPTNPGADGGNLAAGMSALSLRGPADGGGGAADDAATRVARGPPAPPPRGR